MLQREIKDSPHIPLKYFHHQKINFHLVAHHVLTVSIIESQLNKQIRCLI